MFKILTFLFAISFLGACSDQASDIVPDPLTPPVLSAMVKEEQSYFVYSAVLRTEFKDGRYLIANKTGTGTFSSSYDGDRSFITPDIVASYEEENKSVLLLTKRGLLGSENYPISENPFTSRTPDSIAEMSVGVITFSRVGFNSDMSRALVSAAYSCGLLCGSGSFYYLTRTETDWVVVWQQELWVS